MATSPASSKTSISTGPSPSHDPPPVTAAAMAEPARNEWARRLGGPARRAINLLFSVALTFLGLTCVTFFIGRIIPIDPVLAIVGDKASRATYDRVATEIGANLPIPVQYWRYLNKVLHA